MGLREIMEDGCDLCCAQGEHIAQVYHLRSGTLAVCEHCRRHIEAGDAEGLFAHAVGHMAPEPQGPFSAADIRGLIWVQQQRLWEDMWHGGLAIQ